MGRTSTPAERAALLRRVAELHRERRDELAAIIVREMGKPLAAAEGEVDFAADITEFYADHIDEITGDRPIDILGEGTAVIRRSPLGVLLGIMPWNFPYYQVALRGAEPGDRQHHPAQACAAVPQSAAAIAQIYADAGFPVGAYVDVRLTNEQAAEVIADRRVHGVSVTGSERAGAAVAEIAGRNLKKVVLELGGSDPFILLSTDDLDAAVQAAVDARLDNNGQSCNGAKRFLVADDLYDASSRSSPPRWTRRRSAIRSPRTPCSGRSPRSPPPSGCRTRSIAPSRRARRSSRGLARRGVLPRHGDHGCDGRHGRVPRGVLRTRRRRLSRQRRGRGDRDRQRHRVRSRLLRLHDRRGAGGRIADRIDAGMVYVNIVLADSPELPFGGIKRSGTGREMGLLAAEEFVNKKLIRIAG
jgi:succinate-semialdehyde dehydrogenase/glutarate-semialdehyde dehydrogenase